MAWFPEERPLNAIYRWFRPPFTAFPYIRFFFLDNQAERKVHVRRRKEAKISVRNNTKACLLPRRWSGFQEKEHETQSLNDAECRRCACRALCACPAAVAAGCRASWVYLLRFDHRQR